MLEIIKLLLSFFIKKQIENQAEVIELPKKEPELIDFESYITSSGKYPRRLSSPELTQEKVQNAYKLIGILNKFLNELGVNEVVISSGFRTSEANESAHGARRSLHMECLACDIEDLDGSLDRLIESRDDLKKKYGIWQEAPGSTPKWTHCDIKDRGNREKNTFIP